MIPMASKTDAKPAENRAVLYRMVMPGHVCPYGLKSLDLLKREGFEVQDEPLRTRDETDTLKRRLGVSTTPQTLIGGTRIGGYDDLRRYFGKSPVSTEGTSYTPVVAIFAVCALLGLALGWNMTGSPFSARSAELFVALSMTVLAVQKLQDVPKFSLMFLNYDLLARRWVPYASLYPFGEALAGVLMAGRLLPIVSVPVALFIGTVGAVSVFKAVYIDRRELKCACAGGSSNVPLGFVSLTENLFMIGMGLWMGAQALGV
jgi:glutaredoxin